MSRPVVDQTRLPDGYAFTLTWTPDEDQRNFRAALPPEIRDRLPQQAASSGPSIFTALQEQLGLRLESEKAPVEVLVIDRAERPSEN